MIILSTYYSTPTKDIAGYFNLETLHLCPGCVHCRVQLPLFPHLRKAPTDRCLPSTQRLKVSHKKPFPAMSLTH